MWLGCTKQEDWPVGAGVGGLGCVRGGSSNGTGTARGLVWQAALWPSRTEEVVVVVCVVVEVEFDMRVDGEI